MDGSNNINDAIADRIKSHMEEQHKVAVNLDIKETPEY